MENDGIQGQCCDCWFWSDPRTSVCTNERSEYVDGYVNWCHTCSDYKRKLTLEDIRDDRAGVFTDSQTDRRGV